MSKLPGYDDTVICPYNKCHVILRSRIQTHLIKCAKQHPEIKLDTCPFDVTHKFRPEEKNVRYLANNFCLVLFSEILCFVNSTQAHIEECPSRVNFDRYAYSVNTNNAKKDSNPQSKPPPRKTWNNDDDDWD